MNLYRYSRNNGVCFIDALGLADDVHWPNPWPGSGRPGTPWRDWQPPPIVVMPPGGDIVVSTAASSPMQGLAGLPGLFATQYDPVMGAPLGYTFAMAFDLLFGWEPGPDDLLWDLRYGHPPPGESWLVPPRPNRAPPARPPKSKPPCLQWYYGGGPVNAPPVVVIAR
jgi:hypothetical protein